MTTKFHKNLIQAVSDIIHQVIYDQVYADKKIEQVLKSNKSWGARDRSFIAETAYNIIRDFRKIRFCSGNSKKPEHWISTYFLLKKMNPPDWEIYNEMNSERVWAKLEECKSNFAIMQSYPDSLVDLIKEELPDTWERELTALNKPAPLIIRCNTLKTTIKQLQTNFLKEGIETRPIPDLPDALIILEKFNVFGNPLFKLGHFEIQDASSQMVAAFSLVEPGMRVIDACAGAGGKTLHMAALMKNKGRIIALDTESWKLDELKKRARRNGAENLETRVIDGTKVIKRLANSCDRLLLDVPCSGLGVLRRNPDAKWKVDLAFIDRMRNLQKDILANYASMLRPGGKLVYATCSILPSENSKQVSYFCSEHTHFQLEEEKIISPALSGFDGFYMARLTKN
ncbi:MAG: RsmB/NOP family class I SAM-dependent RNA methyltransferase [Saprospiraceae bacterium]|nr:RsmB/NOP family class I SAM-dependent RNA methyltransferase [Saprospiraceae bacterium]MBK7737323.1 RsmB/NOP family class I SAM-dependent RNA methyltransferase [Saprospiraceae bacterium]MBK7914084.1 RsmB/NOP family class I SAM-dependent RNA methyltransferase [Saprospiraceae bacterium]